MGNESSSPRNNDTEENRLRPDASGKIYRSFSSEVSDEIPSWLTERATSVDSLDSFGDGDIGDVSRHNTRPPRSSPISRRKINSFDGGSLKGSITAFQDVSKTGFVDPVLSAAAVGAKARKSKHAYLLKQKELQHQQEEQQRIQEKIRTNNEWKSSLRLLASAAASTATRVAHATAPVLKDAKAVVQTSAGEFAQDLQMEWNKEDEPKFEHDEESVQLFQPMTPIRKPWLLTPSENVDLSPSATTPNQSIRVVRVLEVPIIPTSSPGIRTTLFPHHSLDADDSKEVGPPALGLRLADEQSEGIGDEDKAPLTSAVTEIFTSGEADTENEIGKDLLNEDKVPEIETTPATVETSDPALVGEGVDSSDGLRAGSDIQGDVEPPITTEAAGETLQSTLDVEKTSNEPITTEGRTRAGTYFRKENATSKESSNESNELVQQPIKTEATSSILATADDVNSIVGRNTDDSSQSDPGTTTLESGDPAPIDGNGSTDQIVSDNEGEHRIVQQPQSSLRINSDPTRMEQADSIPSQPQGVDDQSKVSGESEDPIQADDSKNDDNLVADEGKSPQNETSEVVENSEANSGRPLRLMRSESNSISALQNVIGETQTDDENLPTSSYEVQPKSPQNEVNAVPGPTSRLIRSESNSTSASQNVIDEAQTQSDDEKPLVSCDETEPKSHNELPEVMGNAGTSSGPPPRLMRSESKSISALQNVIDETQTQSDGEKLLISPDEATGTHQGFMSSSNEDTRIAAADCANDISNAESRDQRQARSHPDVGKNDLASSPNLEGQDKQSIEEIRRLFEANDTLVYETTANKSNPCESKELPTQSSRRHDLFQRPEDLLSLMISKATGWEVKLKRKGRESESEVDFGRATEAVRRSVFDDEIVHASSSQSVSSSLSPPEIPAAPFERSSTDASSESDTGEAVLWDLYPPKQDVVPGKYAVALADDNGPEEQKLDISFLVLGAGGGSNSVNEHPPSPGTPKNTVIESISSNPLPLSPKRQTRRVKKPSQKAPLDIVNATETSALIQNDDAEQDPLREEVSNVEQQLETLTVKWENEDSGSFPGVPDTEDISEAYEKEEVLDEALLAFSSLDDVNFLRRIDMLGVTEIDTQTTSLPWRHLLASWKHAEIWKAMIASPCTLTFQRFQETAVESDRDSLSSTSTTKFLYQESKIDYGSRISVESDIYLAVRDLSGFSPQTLYGDVKALTGYICDIGPTSFDREIFKDDNKQQAPDYLHQQLPSNASKGKDGSDRISDFHQFAEDSKTMLDDIAKSIVQFSSRNDLFVPEDDEISTTSYSLGVKSYSSIKRKAARKYDGDVTRVLDLLRAQIVFPDEGSLICGLVKLWSFTGNSSAEEVGKDTPDIEILRLKNLFRTSPAGNAYLSPLPTGYRHILINVRLNTGLVVELQFQLSQFYQVLGPAGYELHQALVSGNEEDAKLHTTYPPGFDIFKFTRGILDDVPDMLLSVEKPPTVPGTEMVTEVLTNNQAAEVGSDTPSTVGSMVVAAKKQSQKPEGAPVGIAAMAAAAAAKKQSQKPAGTPVGIAAMAAAAAKKQSQKPEGAPVGIAAMAAAAAAAKKKTSQVEGGSPVGIAAMAAAAAAAKKKTSQVEGGAPVGIAAMAAAAAAKKQSQKPERAPVGIAAMAAAAAAAKQKTQQAEAATEMDVADGYREADVNKEIELVLATMKIGALEAQASPRDFSSFYCLYVLARRLDYLYLVTRRPDDSKDVEKASQAWNVKVKEIQTIAKRLLLRSLAISNQATSTGMVGWLEYGSSNPLERTLSLPFEVLGQLSCNLAAADDWDSASDVLGSLVLRCEQLLPPYHPTTLSAMLDLSAASSMAGNTVLAQGLITRVSDLLSLYLSQHERLFYERQQTLAQFEYSGDKVVCFDDGEDIISLLKAFATSFLGQLSREFLRIVPPSHEVKLFNHSFVADALAVLANCLSAGEDRSTEPMPNSKKTVGESTSSKAHKYYWSLAYEHYQQALRGWLRVSTLTHPSTAATAYSVARSLRELGMLDQALKILTALTSALKENLENPQMQPSEFSHRMVFLMPPTFDKSSGRKQNHAPALSLSESCRNEQTLVLGLWLMAVLTVEQSPDERGRIRALSLLHSASDALRRILGHIKDLDEVTKNVCLELYECIEQEARVLFEPMELIPMPRLPKTNAQAEEKDSVGDFLSPMRQKRWYKEEKKKKNQDYPMAPQRGHESPLEAERESYRKPIIHLI
jgi:hypothetical protein